MHSQRLDAIAFDYHCRVGFDLKQKSGRYGVRNR